MKYKDATWITLLENRIRLAKDYLNEEGSIFVRCDYNGNMYVRLLMNDIFGGENFRNEMVVNRTQEFFKFSHGLNKFMVDTDTLFFYGKAGKSIFNEIKIKREIEKWWEPFLPGNPKDKDDCYRIVFKQKFPAPKGRKWGFSQDQIEELEQEDRIKIENGKIKYAPLGTTLKNNWTDIPGYSRHFDFPTENSEILLKRVIESTSNESDLVMDFFLGSGTTAAVAHKLKRKWIGIEMGEHFYDVVLPRMKKVLAYDKSGISKENDVKEKYNEKNAGGFFKYFNLEQYEQTLKNSVYLPSEPLYNLNDTSIYNQYVFFKDLKFLDKMEIDNKNNKIKFNFNGLYDNIDIAETLSLVKGKFIKSISKDEVVFNDAKIVFSDVDFTALKPLIWW